ncbi:hypothetical protein LXL04_027833 [Taraxacum kok-saghyz]
MISFSIFGIVSFAIWSFATLSTRLISQQFPLVIRGKGEYHIDFVPAPRITEADKINDKKSLQRALDRRLYLLLFGDSYGTPKGQDVWHFPEKVYRSEETLRKCTESALESVIGDLSHTYFVGNAPMGHIAMPPAEKNKDTPSFKIRDLN